MKVFRTIACVTLMALLTVSATADEKPNKGKGKGKGQAPSVTQRLVSGMTLTDEQKEQVKGIDKQFAAKAKEIQTKRAAILTEEQKKAQRDAQKAAKDSGKKPAEARKDVTAALKLTDEQSAQMKEVDKAQQALNTEVIAALKKVLTPEQQEKLPKQKAAGKAGNAKPKKKKDAA
ncbi:MAG: hypothetical protein KDA89_22095 [Planctomycetaceae bacterium]|nr:hypothetical protein [Planctomycetaceae bacterium]